MSPERQHFSSQMAVSATTLSPSNSRAKATPVRCDVVPFDPNYTRLDATKLAARMGFSTWVIKGMKVAAAHRGDSPFTGRYTTLRRAHEWLEQNPEFVASHHLRKKQPPQRN